jgi:DNA-binding transcriptional LysR family regulator
MDRLRLFEVFVRIVERGNLSLAAKDLNLPQPTVSRLLKTLEQQLGAKLIERDTHKMSLTEQGSMLYERARHLLEEVNATEEAIRNSQSEFKGVLRINAPVAFGEIVLPPLLASFQREHPELEFELDLNDRRIDLIEEGVDVALRAGKIDSLYLVAHHLAVAKRVWVASPAYLKKHGKPKNAQDLEKHTFLPYGLQADTQAIELKQGQERIKIAVKGQLRCNNGRVIATWNEAGLGISEAVEFIVHDAIASKRLVTVLPDFVREGLPIYALHAPGRFVKPKVRAFIQMLKESIPTVPGFTAN